MTNRYVSNNNQTQAYPPDHGVVTDIPARPLVVNVMHYNTCYLRGTALTPSDFAQQLAHWALRPGHNTFALNVPGTILKGDMLSIGILMWHID